MLKNRFNIFIFYKIIFRYIIFILILLSYFFFQSKLIYKFRIIMIYFVTRVKREYLIFRGTLRLQSERIIQFNIIIIFRKDGNFFFFFCYDGSSQTFVFRHVRPRYTSATAHQNRRVIIISISVTMSSLGVSL